MSYFRKPPESLETVIETARLTILRSYSGLPSNDVESLSGLSREAASSFGATHAAVSFVDDAKVWFGGAFGFAEAQTSREHSFCDAVVRSTAPLLVPDGLADPRFWHHAMVRGEPGLRCYAGVPLVDHGGYTLGTVAAYSTQPSVFAPAILQKLSALAGLVRDFLAESRSISQVEPCATIDEAPPTPRVQGWLGVKTLTTEDGRRGRVPGVTVLSIASGSPAIRAGLRPTDILQSIGGKELFVSADVAAAMAGQLLGSKVRIRFRRAGSWHQCEVTVRSRRTRLNGR